MPDAAGLELAGSAAERALAAAAHPTVVQLMGTGPFDALARVHWRYYPPQRGDLARWGERLAAGAAFDFKA